MWSWIPDSIAGYTVRGAYNMLTSGTVSMSTAPMVSAPLLWRKDIPLKVSVFAWRLFRNRLPTKANLFRRGIVQNDAQMCVTGCGLVESDAHLFLHCDIFGQVWQLVRHWLSVSSADPATVVDHFHQFGTSSGFAKSRCSFMHLIWFASSWVIWKERNARIFRAKESTTYQLLEKI
jgi:hypothetical protein